MASRDGRRGPPRPRPGSSRKAKLPRPAPSPEAEPRPIQPHVADAVKRLSEQLPQLLDEALRRVKKGKPPTLLRALRGLIRDLQAMNPPEEDTCSICGSTLYERAVAEILFGVIRQHPRDWLAQRMPGFLDGLDHHTPEKPPDTEDTQVSAIPLDTDPKS